MIKNKKQAEDLVYKSYMKAAKRLKYAAADSEKRHPEYTKAVIKQLDDAYQNENILVTGSKGKGSVSVMISALLAAHGKTTGLLTSPHILDFNERIRINGECITDGELVSACKKIEPTLELIDMTIAENEYISPIGIQALIALLHFGRKTDINVFECGKGVRYDDINNLSRKYSVINRIFAEHTRELGGTVEKIASDKAEIITSGQKAAYTSAQTPEVMDILEKRAGDCGVLLKKFGTDFSCRNVHMTRKGTEFDVITQKNEYNGLSLPLLGRHQAENAALAVAVCEDVLGSLDCLAVKEAFSKIEWHGRLEIISNEPLVIMDACINRVSAELVKETLDGLPHEKTAFILGIPKDKDYEGVAKCVSGSSDTVIFTAAENPHYKFESSQAAVIKNAVFEKNINNAIRAALKSKADLICILGTTALIAEISQKYLQGAKNEIDKIFCRGHKPCSQK